MSSPPLHLRQSDTGPFFEGDNDGDTLRWDATLRKWRVNPSVVLTANAISVSDGDLQFHALPANAAFVGATAVRATFHGNPFSGDVGIAGAFVNDPVNGVVSVVFIALGGAIAGSQQVRVTREA